MKKAVSILILLALAFSASATAADRSDYVGAWVSASDTDSGGSEIVVFFLSESGTLFFLNQLFSTDEIGFGRQYIGLWYETPGGIHVKFGNHAESNGFISADGFLMLSLGTGYYIPYGKVPEYDYGN